METTSTITILQQLLDEDVSRFVSAEAQLKNNLPEWITQAGAISLKTILYEYTAQVNQHIEKLDAYATEEQINALSISNRIMQAYLEETNEKLSKCTHADVKDACLLAAIQSINHFKISAYGTAAAFANILNLNKAAALFHEAELNEKSMDDRLSYLAEHEINKKAKSTLTLPM